MRNGIGGTQVGRRTRHRVVRFVAAVLATLTAGVVIQAQPAAAVITLPSGFSFEQVFTAQDVIFTSLAFAPDGRIFLADKAGTVRVVENGALLPTPFIDISADVNNYFEHGMTGIALDPAFPASPYVYLYYVYDPPGLAADAPGVRFARVERITANTANTNVAASTNARTVLFGGAASATAIQGVACRRNSAPVEDCIAVDSNRHATGDLKFGGDGALYAGVGDSDRLPTGPQDPHAPVGKIFRINPANGLGYTNNPFYAGNLNTNAARVFTLGNRNPWRFVFHPTTGEMLIGDVGENQWEAIYRGVSGANYGWPCYEGGNKPFGAWASTTTCQTLYAQTPGVTPVYTYAHNGIRSSVTAGAFYTGTSYPTAYRNGFFWGDYGRGTLAYLTPSGANYSNVPFGDGFGVNSIVSMGAQPGGDVHMLTLGGFNSSSISGTLWRLKYTAAGNLPPVAAAAAVPSQGPAPLNVSFSTSGSSDPNNDPLTFAWTFGDGTSGAGAQPSHNYANQGVYTATVVASDTSGATSSASVIVRVGPVPIITITAPEAGLSLPLGAIQRFTATAIDPVQGDISSQIIWSSRLYHAGHLHPDPVVAATGPTVDVTMNDHDDDIRYEMCARVTNQVGIPSLEECRSVSVRLVTVTIESDPTALPVTLAGLTQLTPFTAQISEGAVRRVAANPVVGCQSFSSWSDAGAATHDVSVPASMTLTASYVPIAGCVAGGELRVSETDIRTPSIALQGATLPAVGSRYVFFDPGAIIYSSVSFWLDNPAMTGAARRTESLAPWDFDGGSVTNASATNLASLSVGTHSVTTRAIRADLSAFVSTAQFTVGITPPPPDTTPPTVAAVVPANTATGVAVGALPTVTFTEPVTALTGITLAVDGGAALATTKTLAGNVVTITPAAALATGTTYRINVPTTVTDIAGNPLATAFTSTFATVAAPPVDTTPPTVTAVAPANSATSIAVGALPTVTFSEPVTALTAITLAVDGGAAVATSKTLAGNTVTITPAALVAGTTYRITVPVTVTDIAGNPLATTFTSTFTTATVTPPPTTDILKVSRSTSRAPAVALADNNWIPGEQVTVFLDTTQAAVSVRFYLDTPTTGTPRRTEGTAPWDFNGGSITTATPFTNNLTAGTHIMRALLTRANGTTQTYESTFTVGTTPPPPDTTPPTVTGVVPANTATGVAIGVVPTVTFTEPVTALTGITLAIDGGAPVPVTRTSTGNSVTITPTVALTASTTYRITVPTTVTDTAGNALAIAFTSTFTTAAAPPVDTTPPTITVVAPTNTATGVAPDITPTVTFSEPVTALAGVALAVDGGATVATTKSLAGNTVTITPTAPLAAATTYRITVPTIVTDTAGNALAIAFTSTFTTAISAPTADILKVSRSATRAPSLALQGNTSARGEQLYIFLDTAQVATSVRFYLDTPVTGAALRTEGTAPWDFNGGSITTAIPFANNLTVGTHTVRAVLTRVNGTTQTFEATFTVT